MATTITTNKPRPRRSPFALITLFRLISTSVWTSGSCTLPNSDILLVSVSAVVSSFAHYFVSQSPRIENGNYQNDDDCADYEFFTHGYKDLRIYFVTAGWITTSLPLASVVVIISGAPQLQRFLSIAPMMKYRTTPAITINDTCVTALMMDALSNMLY